MNDKNKDHFDVENESKENSEKKPFVKKAAKASAFIYLSLAVLVVIAATVGIFSISYDFKDEISKVSLPEIDLDGFDRPAVPDYQTPSEPENDPVNNEQSGIEAETSQVIKEEDVFFCPVRNAEIQKKFSMDALVFSETLRDYRVHSGVDLAAPVGTEVVAYAKGKVIQAEEDYFYGMTVAIRHADGEVSYYMNLDPELAENISVGAEIEAGDPVGKIGETAKAEHADKPHLHFEIRKNGELINPESEILHLMDD